MQIKNGYLIRLGQKPLCSTQIADNLLGCTISLNCLSRFSSIFFLDEQKNPQASTSKDTSNEVVEEKPVGGAKRKPESHEGQYEQLKRKCEEQAKTIAALSARNSDLENQNNRLWVLNYFEKKLKIQK